MAERDFEYGGRMADAATAANNIFGEVNVCVERAPAHIRNEKKNLIVAPSEAISLKIPARRMPMEIGGSVSHVRHEQK